MSTSRNVALSGLAALMIAVSVIGVAIYSGITPTAGIAGPGTLSILLTDPPHVPAGVTAVYITYSDLGVHVSRAGNDSGWTILKSSGTVELLSTVNVSQTLTSNKIQSGNYNLLRFNISSALVTYNGVNYTAFVPSAKLTVPIIGGIEVSSFKPSATIIDIEPTVMNIGSDSTPEFIIRPAAKAFPVPSSEVSQQMEHEGFRMSLLGRHWWRDVQQRFTANLQITSTSLSANSLDITAMNTGSDSTTLRLVIVSPLATVLHHGDVPTGLANSAVFVVLSNQTLVSLQGYIASAMASGEDTRAAILSSLMGQGYSLTAGSSLTLSHSGPVHLGFLRLSSIVSGQQYLVTMIGDGAVASFVVRAS